MEDVVYVCDDVRVGISDSEAEHRARFRRQLQFAGNVMRFVTNTVDLA